MLLTALLTIPFGAALALWPVRRVRQIAAPIAALVYVLLAVLAPLAAGEDALDLLGRSLALAPEHAIYVSVLSVALALLMAGGGFVQESALVWSGSLVTFGLLLAAICATSMQLASAFMAIAVLGIACCLLAPTTAELTMRTIIVLLCGTLLLLLAGWAAEASQAEHPLSLAILGQPATLFGLALLLGVFPFGLWVPPLGRVERPTAAFLGGCALGLIAALRLGELGTLAGPGTLAVFLRWGGIATLIYGAVGALLPRGLDAVVTYAATADLGVAALAMGIAPIQDTNLAAQHLAYRALACATLWVASRVLCKCFGSDDLRPLGGAFRRAPLTLSAVLLAGLSLAGLPPMAGFASRAIILGMTEMSQSWAVVWALSALSPAWGIVRVVVASWGPTPPPGSRREPVWLALLLLASALGLLLVGILPGLSLWLQDLLLR